MKVILVKNVLRKFANNSINCIIGVKYIYIYPKTGISMYLHLVYGILDMILFKLCASALLGTTMYLFYLLPCMSF